MRTKIREIQNRLNKEEIDGIVVSNIVNIRYLTGFTGSTAELVILKDGGDILVDSRYWEQVHHEVNMVKPVLINGDINLFSFLKDLSKKEDFKRLAFEGYSFNYFKYKRLFETLENVELVPVENWVEEMRMVKDNDEIEKIKKALKIAEEALEEILEIIKPGVSERDLAIELEYQMAKKGSEKVAFDTIVASGPRSALPHGKASNKKIYGNEFIVFDFGAVYEGYHSDITRTVYVGNPNEEELLVYNIIFEAQKKAEEVIKEGIESSFVDKVSRDIIQDNGYGNYFGHGLGHGVGLEIHELPRLSPKGKWVLKKNMVVTVEPGIYIPGRFGLRIEDMVVVGEEKATVLNSFTNKLMII